MSDPIAESCSLLKVAVVLSGTGWLMKALIDGCQSGEIPAEIVVAIANDRDPRAIKRANQLGIPMVLINRQDYGDRQDFEREIHKQLQAYQAEFVCFADFNYIVSPWFVNQWDNRITNCHPLRVLKPVLALSKRA
jgi:phosphoribosylglycinamide formyltransferase-1